MDPVAVLAIINALITTGVNAMAGAQKVSELLAQRHAAGQSVTQADLDALFADNDAARQALVDAIAKA